MKTRTKVILSTLAALLLLAAAIAAGLNAVFTVTYVRADFTTFSEEGDRDAEELKQKLDRFVGKSTTFLDLGEIEKTVKEYPHFSILSLGKKFPATVEISLAERREEYAFCAEDGSFTFLDEEGRFLTEGNQDTLNRSGGQNILLKGFSLSVAETGEAEGEYFADLLTVMGEFAKVLPEVRVNVVSVELDLGTTDLNFVTFRIRMKEGVVIVIRTPFLRAAEKAAMAAASYNALGDEERLYGFITVFETAEGELRSVYVRSDLFS